MFSNRLSRRFNAQCHQGQLEGGMIGDECLVDAMRAA